MSAPRFQEPRKRFTYCQKYLSAMVEPQDSEEEEKKALKKSRQAWLTADGFQLTGLHKSPESDSHFRLPPLGTEVHRVEWGLRGRGGVRRDLPPYCGVLHVGVEGKCTVRQRAGSRQVELGPAPPGL